MKTRKGILEWKGTRPVSGQSIHETVPRKNTQVVAPLYMTNNHLDPYKSEKRKKELAEKRDLENKKRNLHLREERTIYPVQFERAIDYLKDVVDDNNFQPEQGKVNLID